ncbi:MAG: acetylxylan esterase [Verrucomicrobiales bacterium]|nr:acetylxylan esterase [Verrucomicrobiales bacterium]
MFPIRLPLLPLPRIRALAFVLAALLVPFRNPASAGEALPSPADRALAAYFAAETDAVARRSSELPKTPADAKARLEADRSRLQDMLGLLPFPERTDLRPVVTGQLDGPDIVVERIHFQSQPGLYVTANLYRPKTRSGPLPAVLYLCGHARVFTNGVSCGNKTAYQHHGIWFARHGYVCLLIDTLQLGEIEGHHHGTHRLGQWWWNNRGYTPAGVEAWNGIRAVDYLVSRPEVDPSRIGVTGRSGGGSYSWTVAALDDRIRVAAPVAGITDLHNHVVDGVVEGHCDCMFFVNTFRWDFARHAALIAPRPLLIVNTDSDGIFPLDGVQRVHAATREVYRLLEAPTHLGLVIGPGDHKDTQDLQVPVFRWFHRHLKGEEPLIAEAAERRFSPLDLRVFSELPSDARNTNAAEWFGPATFGGPRAPEAPVDLASVRERLRTRVFAGWPDNPAPPDVRVLEEATSGELRWNVFAFESQPNVPLELRVLIRGRSAPERIVLNVLDAKAASDFADRLDRTRFSDLAGDLEPGTAVAWFVPRGMGTGAWTGDDRKQVHIRRRFMLLGQTLDGMRVWDILRAVNVLTRNASPTATVDLRASGPSAVNSLLAVLVDPARVREARLTGLPTTFRDGPDYLNIARILELPDALRLARTDGVRVITE